MYETTMNVINPEALINAFTDLSCGKVNAAQISSKDFEIKQTTTKPLTGYIPPLNFPDCCENHRRIFQIGVERFEAFPNCCKGHKKLNSANWFKKSNYSYLPYKLVTTISYTWHCIGQCIEKPNWYKEITDYIDYTKKSYGQFPEGFGSPFGAELYLFNLEKNLEGSNEIPENKKIKIIEFIKSYRQEKIDIEATDLNLLIGKYKEWLKIFPFELAFFSHLKPFFENQLPILDKKGETNIYTGMTGFKLKTKKELLGFLLSTTGIIIKEINTRNLYENKLLSEVDQLQIEILMAKRKLELQKLNRIDWEDRKEYIKLLKTWLKGEKCFLSDLKPLITSINLPHTTIMSQTVINSNGDGNVINTGNNSTLNVNSSINKNGLNS